MLAIWSLVPLPFVNPAWTSRSSQFIYCWSLAWRIFSMTLLACISQLCGSLNILWHCLSLPFFGIGMKTDLFQSCNHCWVFQICWHIECSTFTASSFRIWNISAGIPPFPLALFVVMIPKAYLTSYSRMSRSRRVIMPSWLSASLRFLYSSVYSCHLLISSVSFQSILFLSFVEPIFTWSVHLVRLIFLKRSLVFHILLFSSFCALIHLSVHWFLISPCYSLELCIEVGIYFLFSFALCFSSFLSYL